MACFEQAKDKVMMGAERKSLVMSDDEKKLTAYHEAGHAVIALHEPASDPIHKATIIPRGRALGMVMRLPERDRVSLSFDKLQADLAVAMGGRVAEEMIFGANKVTTGASSDIQMATSMARRMVTDWGMSAKLGPLKYSTDNEDGYYNPSKGISDQTAQVVDAETKRFVDEGYNRARAILTAQLDKLHGIALALLEFETLNGDELRALYAGEKLARAEAQAPEMKKIDKPKGSII
jgi:cell division protease FtsH